MKKQIKNINIYVFYTSLIFSIIIGLGCVSITYDLETAQTEYTKLEGVIKSRTNTVEEVKERQANMLRILEKEYVNAIRS